MRAELWRVKEFLTFFVVFVFFPDFLETSSLENYYEFEVSKYKLF